MTHTQGRTSYTYSKFLASKYAIIYIIFVACLYYNFGYAIVFGASLCINNTHGAIERERDREKKKTWRAMTLGYKACTSDFN